MARFAPVCPPTIYGHLMANQLLGDYNLLLAHDVVDREPEYRDIFGRRPYMNRVTILDNSIIELGAAVNIEMIAEAARICAATIIVLPDVLLDGPATVRSCVEASVEWEKHLNNALGKHKWGYMFVPQGKTEAEFAACAEACWEMRNVKMWGIPRNIVQYHGTRSRMIDYCQAIAPDVPIHMLGFSDNVVDDVLCARKTNVLGIDSAVPLRMASVGQMFWPSEASKLPPRGDWWNHVQWNDTMAHNVVMTRKLVRDRAAYQYPLYHLQAESTITVG